MGHQPSPPAPAAARSALNLNLNLDLYIGLFLPAVEAASGEPRAANARLAMRSEPARP